MRIQHAVFFSKFDAVNFSNNSDSTSIHEINLPIRLISKESLSKKTLSLRTLIPHRTAKLSSFAVTKKERLQKSSTSYIFETRNLISNFHKIFNLHSLHYSIPDPHYLHYQENSKTKISKIRKESSIWKSNYHLKRLSLFQFFSNFQTTFHFRQHFWSS